MLAKTFNCTIVCSLLLVFYLHLILTRLLLLLRKFIISHINHISNFKRLIAFNGPYVPIVPLRKCSITHSLTHVTHSQKAATLSTTSLL